MHRAISYPPRILGAVITVGTTWFLRQRRVERGSLPLWQSVLARRYGIEKAQ